MSARSFNRAAVDVNVELLGKWVAVIGAVVAAVTGVWNLRLLLRGKKDDFVVGFGRISPCIEQETMMHVISLSDHQVMLSDWGFIEADGSFLSMPFALERGIFPSEHIVFHGSRKLEKRCDYLESGCMCNRRMIGVYATSIAQQRPTLRFSPDVACWRRIWMRIRLRFYRNYF